MNGSGSRLILCVLLAFLLSLSLLGQQNASTDNFIGKWKLNVDKSKLPPERETITIELQGSQCKISDDVAYDNGTELNFWTLTDMKGTVSKLTQSNGKPMNEEWRVTREDANNFVIDSRPFRNVSRYTVGADGHTLTKRPISSELVVAKVNKNGTPEKVVQILVFDRRP